MALKDIELHLGADGVTQIVQGLKQVEDAVGSMGRKTQSASQQMETSWQRMSGSLASVNRLLATFGVGFTTWTIIREVRSAIEAIDSLRTSTIQIAAIITTMQGPKNVAGHYAQATKYAEALAIKLQEVDAKSFANYDTLLKMVNVMSQQGVVMDLNNKKQVDAFTSLSNAVAMYTTGQNQSIQANQEIRALMSGQATQGSQLALQIDSMAKSSGLYKGGLKEIVDLGKKHGDTLERMTPFLVGINAASGDIERTWGAVTSSAETAKNMIQRVAFSDIYKGAIKMGGEFIATLKNNADSIGNSIKLVMETMATATKIAAVYFAVFVAAPAVLAAATTALQRYQMALMSLEIQLASTTAVGRAWALVVGTETVTAALAAASAMGKLKIAGATVFAFFAGWELGKLLYDQFDGIKKFSIALVGGILKLIAEVKYAYLELVEVGKGAWDWLHGKGYTGDAGVQRLIKEHAAAKANIDAYMDEELAKLNKKIAAVSPVPTPKLPPGKEDDPHADQLRKAAASLKESWLDTSRALNAKIEMSGMDEVGKKFREAQLEADNLRDEYKTLPPALKNVAYALIDADFAAADAAIWNDVLAKRAEEYTKNAEQEATELKRVTDAYRSLQEIMDPGLKDQREYAAQVKVLSDAYSLGLIPSLDAAKGKLDEYIKIQKYAQESTNREDLTKSTFSGNSFSNAQANDYGKVTTALEEMNKMYALQANAVAELAARKKEATEVEAKGILGIYNQKLELGRLEKQQTAQGIQFTRDQLSAYRTLFGTTAQLFKEGSKERRAMHNLEKAATIAEIAMQMQKNLAIIAGYFAVSTAATAAAAVENTANSSVAVTAAVAAVATQGKGDPYTAFARVAAMIGLMTGVLAIAGIAFGGGGGGGKAPVLPPPPGFGKEGTGGGIGMPIQTFKSEDSLRMLAASAANASLAIDRVADGLTKIGDLFSTGQGKMFAGTLATPAYNQPRSPTSQLFADTKRGINSFGLGVSPVTALATAMFGFGNKWQTIGGGFELGLAGGDITNRNYLDRKKQGGWFTKSKTAIDYSAGSPESTEMFRFYLNQVKDTISTAAVAMGAVTEMAEVTLAGTKIATANRKPEDIQKDLEAWFTKAADMLAQSVVGLQEFTYYGESAFDAVVRLSTSLQGMNEKLELTGHALVSSTLAGANAVWKLVDAFGGLDKMEEAVDNYFKAMFSESRQNFYETAQAVRQVNTAFGEINLVVPETKAEFINLVNAQDLTTESGAAFYVQLMEISEGFGVAQEALKKQEEAYQSLSIRKLQATDNEALADILELISAQTQEYIDWMERGYDLVDLKIVQELEYQKAIKQVTETLSEASKKLIDTSKKTLTTAVDTSLKILNTLKGFLYGPQSGLSPESTYRLAKEQFASATPENVSDRSTALMEASRAFNASSAAYFYDRQAVITKLSAMAQVAPKLSDVDVQIGLLTQIKQAIQDGDTATLSALGATLTAASVTVGTAGNDLSIAMTAIQTVLDGKNPDGSPILGPGTAAPDLQKYLTDMQTVLNGTDVAGNQLITDPLAVQVLTNAISAVQMALNGTVDAEDAYNLISGVFVSIQGALAGTIDVTAATDVISGAFAAIQRYAGVIDTTAQQQTIQAGFDTISGYVGVVDTTPHQQTIQSGLDAISNYAGVIDTTATVGTIAAAYSAIQDSLNAAIDGTAPANTITSQFAAINTALSDSLTTTSVTITGLIADFIATIDAANAAALSATVQTPAGTTSITTAQQSAATQIAAASASIAAQTASAASTQTPVTVAPPPVTPTATFYEHDNYGSAFQTAGVGEYALAAKNDALSSLKVGAGTKVTLFEHAGFGGSSLVVTADTPSLSGLGWNDRASSYRIEKLPGFAMGGITSGPSLAGEGVYREAIIPLPDGRSVPVTMQGGTGAETVAELKEQNRLLKELLAEAKANVRVNATGFAKVIAQGDEATGNSRVIAQKSRQVVNQ